MNSRITEEFVGLFSALPDAVKSQTRKAYRLWRRNPSHPGLHFKRVHSREPLYSVRVSKGWRVLGLLSDDTMHWFWVGTHADYDHLLKRL